MQAYPALAWIRPLYQLILGKREHKSGLQSRASPQDLIFRRRTADSDAVETDPNTLQSSLINREIRDFVIAAKESGLN